MSCLIAYIPERLHTNGRENISDFFIDEIIYRRCPVDDVGNPFDKISLVDLSVNRTGDGKPPLSEADDVLFNIRPENGKGDVIKQAVVRMVVKELDGANQYRKSEVYTNPQSGATNTCLLHLKHKKEECMYPHSAFEVYYDETEMTFENYDSTLKKNSYLKSWCKNEISKMIIKEEIRINWQSTTN